MSGRVSLASYLQEDIIYPIFVDGIKFNYEEFSRDKPKWFWLPKKKNAFLVSRFRIITLYNLLRNTEQYKYLDTYQRVYKTRDYLNTGKEQDFPIFTKKKPKNLNFPYFKNFD